MSTEVLSVSGMTCASCVSRVEQQLNAIDGVQATVNLATETAQVTTTRPVPLEQLLRAVESAGYHAEALDASQSQREQAEVLEAQAQRSLAGLRRRLWGSLALSIPVVAISMIPALHIPGWQWAVMALTLPVMLWGGWPFHVATVANIRHGVATMDTLITIGTFAAFGWSLYMLLTDPAGGGHTVYFETAASVTTFVLAGRYLEHKARHRAGDALRSLMQLSAKQATVLDGDRERTVPVERLAAGDLMLVRPGELVPTDGTVVDGSSSVDQSLVTGESVPVEVGVGDEVIGSTLNVDGLLRVRVTKVGNDTQLARIARLVTEAQAQKADVQRLVDRVAAVFVPAVISIAVVVLIAWLAITRDPDAAFTAAVAVLIIACPCALGLATPTAMLVGTGRAAQLGILVSGPAAIETSGKIDTVVFDKTGTLTTGQMRVVSTACAPGVEEPELLRWAGLAEAGSEHPIAKAIVARAREAVGPLQAPSFVQALPGSGVSTLVDGKSVLVGSPELMAQFRIGVDDATASAVERERDGGRTVVAVAVDQRVIGLVSVADTPRPTSRDAVQRLRALGLTPILLTGDHERSARAVAQEVGIDEVIAGVKPEQKLAEVRRLRDEGHAVAMVGDGVNDAAALAAADLGIALGSGADAAMKAADMTLVRSDPESVVQAVRVARRTLAVIRGNLFWAFAYNVAAIPLAAFGLLSPMIAGAAMAFSSVFVVTNSLRLRRFH